MSCFCTTWLWTDNLYWLMNFDVTQVMHTKMKDTDLMPQVAIWTFYLEKQKKRQNGHTWSIPLPFEKWMAKLLPHLRLDAALASWLAFLLQLNEKISLKRKISSKKITWFFVKDWRFKSFTQLLLTKDQPFFSKNG